MEARVAVLEEIAQATKASLARIESRLDAISGDQKADFRWLLTAGVGATVAVLTLMAHGFHWI